MNDTDGVVRYSVGAAGRGTFKVSSLDANSAEVASVEGGCGQITIPNVKLWDPGAAYLYRARVTFGEDVYEQPFGVRAVRMVTRSAQIPIPRRGVAVRGSCARLVGWWARPYATTCATAESKAQHMAHLTARYRTASTVHSRIGRRMKQVEGFRVFGRFLIKQP